MPKPYQVREFWAGTSLWRFKGFDSRFEFMQGDYCFACGFTNGDSKTERAHIVPMWQGGANSCQNLHLLCGRCHLDSEDLGCTQTDPFQSKYWHWFFARTIYDRTLSSAIAMGFNWSDFTKTDEHLLCTAKTIFHNKPDVLKRIDEIWSKSQPHIERCE